MEKYLVTSIDGYTLEVNNCFLEVDNKEDAIRYIQKQLGDDEVNITYHDNGNIIGWIPCDEHHMIKNTELWLRPFKNVEEVTV